MTTAPNQLTPQSSNIAPPNNFCTPPSTTLTHPHTLAHSMARAIPQVSSLVQKSRVTPPQGPDHTDTKHVSDINPLHVKSNLTPPPKTLRPQSFNLADINWQQRNNYFSGLTLEALAACFRMLGDKTHNIDPQHPQNAEQYQQEILQNLNDQQFCELLEHLDEKPDDSPIYINDALTDLAKNALLLGNSTQQQCYIQTLDGQCLKQTIHALKSDPSSKAQQLLPIIFSNTTQTQYNDLMNTYDDPINAAAQIQENLLAVDASRRQAFFTIAPLKTLWCCNEACRTNETALPSEKRTLQNLRRELFSAIHQEQFNLLMAHYPPTHFPGAFIENLELSNLGARHRHYLGLNGEQLKAALTALRQHTSSNTSLLQKELFSAISQTQFNRMMMAFEKEPLSSSVLRENLMAASSAQRITFFARLSPGKLWSFNEALRNNLSARPVTHRTTNAIRQELFQAIDQHQFNGLMTHYPARIDPAVFIENLTLANAGIRHNFFLTLHPFYLQDAVTALRELAYSNGQAEAIQQDLFNAINQKQFNDLMAVYDNPRHNTQPLKLNLLAANDLQRKNFFAKASADSLWYYNELFRRCTPTTAAHRRTIQALRQTLFNAINQKQFNRLMYHTPPTNNPTVFADNLKLAPKTLRANFIQGLSAQQIADTIAALNNGPNSTHHETLTEILNGLDNRQFELLMNHYNKAPLGPKLIREALAGLSPNQYKDNLCKATPATVHTCYAALKSDRSDQPTDRRSTNTLKQSLVQNINQNQFNALVLHYPFTQHPETFLEMMLSANTQKRNHFFNAQSSLWQKSCLVFLKTQNDSRAKSLLRSLSPVA